MLFGPGVPEKRAGAWKILVDEGWFRAEPEVTFGPKLGAALGLSIERQTVSWTVVNDPTGQSIGDGQVPFDISPIALDDEAQERKLPFPEFRAGIEDILRDIRKETGMHALAGVGVAWQGAIRPDGEPVHEFDQHHESFKVVSMRDEFAAAAAAAGFTRAGPPTDNEGPPPVHLINDADADLLHEVRWGVARDHSQAAGGVLGVKICGSIGGSVMHRGEFAWGVNGRNGEMGHARVPPVMPKAGRPAPAAGGNGFPNGQIQCHCDQPDCIARVASGRALVEALNDGTPVDDYNAAGRELEKRIARRDARSSHPDTVFRIAGEALGRALQGPAAALGADLVIVTAFPWNDRLVEAVRYELAESPALKRSDWSVLGTEPSRTRTAAGAARYIIEREMLPRLEDYVGIERKLLPHYARLRARKQGMSAEAEG
ncbi:MAG TPA: ROK family protein [Solirubrobacteraceae bacterium]